MTRSMLIVVAGLLAVTLACGTEAAPTAKPAAPAAGAPAAAAPAAPAAPAGAVAAAAVNAKCPMMGHAITADGGTATFKGHTIGFCCEGCAPKFEKLDDAGKIAALSKAGTTLPE